MVNLPSLRPQSRDRVFRSRRGQRGQSLTEAALMLPILIVVALGVSDVGRGFSYREDLSNATRDGARVAARQAQQATGTAACAAAGVAPTATATAHIPSSGGDSSLLDLSGSGNGKSILQSIALESSSDGTIANSRLSGATVTVTWHCLAGAAVSNNTATTTDPNNVSNGSATIEIKVTCPFGLITPIGSKIAAPILQADVFVRAEY